MSDTAWSHIYLTWEVIKPWTYTLLLIFFVPLFIKWSILDDITSKIDDAVRHLDVIEREAVRTREFLAEMNYSISCIEKELQWYSSKNTFATEIIKRLDAIEMK